MNFAMLTAEAAGGEAANYTFLIMIVVMVAALYFLMWRPQKKKEKQANEKRNSIEVGDEVTTIGGIVGRVVSLKEDTFVIETAGERSRMRFKRWAIQDVNKLMMEAEVAEPAAKIEKKKAEKTTADKE